MICPLHFKRDQDSMFLFVIYKGFFDDDKQISMTKFFRLDKRKMGYVGNE